MAAFAVAEGKEASGREAFVFDSSKEALQGQIRKIAVSSALSSDPATAPMS